MASKTEYEVLLEMAAKLDPSYRTAMENAKKGVKGVGEGAEESRKDIDALDIAVGNLVANGISKLISAGIEGAKTIYNLAEETREFRQDMGTLEAAFDSAGFTVDEAAQTWKDLYAIFGEDDRAVEAANNISRMAKSQEELNDWVTITTGIWGSYQDALPVEALAESAAESAKVGKITGNLADALNWSSEAAEMFAEYMSEDVLTAEDAFNEALAECSNEQERQALINKTLMRLYGNAADKYEETAASVMDANRAQAEYLRTQAEMGERIEPVTVAVKKGLNELMNAGMQLLANVDFAAWAARIETGFSWLANTGIPFFIRNLPVLGTAIAGVGAILVAYNFTKIIGGITTALGKLSVALAAPVNIPGLIVTGIVLLVTAFVYLWNNCEAFRNFWINLWDGIKTACSNAWNFITTNFSWAANAITGYFGGIIAAAKGVATFFVGIFQGDMAKAVEGLKAIFGGLKSAWTSSFKGAANAIISVLNWLIGKINTISIGPLPDWAILGEYAGAEIGFKIPKIPMLAEGGIATGPTLAMIGEGKEDEAVLPLSKLGSLMGDTSEAISIVYSPQITVMPGANVADVKAATEQTFEQFKAYMDRYLRDRKRLNFT